MVSGKRRRGVHREAVDGGTDPPGEELGDEGHGRLRPEQVSVRFEVHGGQREEVVLDGSGRRLSDRDVIDHLLGILFGAHDTTTSALTTMCIKLAGDPAWQERLRAECRAAGEERGEAPEHGLLDRLPLTDAFFRETLRLYSPLQMVPRRSVREFRFEGHRIPANAPILLFPQATHFDPECFPDPERFDPRRFVDAPTPEPFAFIPFGRGSHTAGPCAWGQRARFAVTIGLRRSAIRCRHAPLG